MDLFMDFIKYIILHFQVLSISILECLSTFNHQKYEKKNKIAEKQSRQMVRQRIVHWRNERRRNELI